LSAINQLFFCAVILQAVVLGVTAILAVPCGAAEIAGRATVIDGDTIEIHGQHIRLFGVDAPESGQTCEADGKEYRCGKDAAFALADKIGRQTVKCEDHGRDRYGREVTLEKWSRIGVSFSAN
jgi:endonuclease YncB( thermonuclease family)